MNKPDKPRIVFLIDIDNTLLNNDQLKVDMDVKLDGLLGNEQSRRFWELYEAVRKEEDVVDIPETVRRFQQGYNDPERYAQLQRSFDTVNFASYLYPDALDTLKYLGDVGTTVILTDGDPVFQRAKATKSGIASAVDNRVLLYIHKQEHLDEVTKLYPADRYVMIDDKDRILNDVARLLGERVVTVFVCQGKYAHNPALQSPPEPNLTVEKISDLRQFSAEEFYSGQFHAGVEACLPESAPVVASS